MWNQLVKFNTNVKYRGGWCLEAVQKGFNSLHWYATAYKQWEAEPNKHMGRPIKGLEVPVYFSIEGNAAGHIAVVLSDGRVASASYAGNHDSMAIHANIDQLIKDYADGGVKLKYLGWGEHCANLRVVEKKGDVMSEEEAKTLFRFGLHREPENEKAWKPYVGMTFAKASKAIMQSQEWLSQNHVTKIGYAESQKKVKSLESELAKDAVQLKPGKYLFK